MFALSSSGPRVVPARLSYLAIFNPSLGPTDETVRDQIVFYYSAKHESQREGVDPQDRSGAQAKGQRATEETDSSRGGHNEDDEENEKLRQVGLAQGMVNFVKNFSNGTPLESVETDRTRTLVRQVEPNWWILASVELTRLPKTHAAQKKPQGQDKVNGTPNSQPHEDVEYSSREVASSQLLLSQLDRAHRGFLLHHAPSLSDLWARHNGNRDSVCTLLQRYWLRFVDNWDVLLHGNPVADLYDGVKLAVGGELGIGVGEEEYGSGEREVLEDFAHRTEGLLELLVARYGDAPVAEIAENRDGQLKTSKVTRGPEPWLGNGEDPRAEDGIIFRGIGGISNRSMATISQWMDSIFMYGQYAYGVSENPTSRPRHRRKSRPGRSDGDSGGRPYRKHSRQVTEAHPRVKSPMRRAPDLRRRAMENNASPPGIPASLVGAVERSLDEAITKASARSSNRNSGEHLSGPENTKGDEQSGTSSTSLFDTGNVMKYLSLGYGSSWTLNPKGFSPDKPSDDDSKLPDPVNDADADSNEENPPGEPLEQQDPTPIVSDEELPFVQRLEQSNGKFLIGLSGDLENTEFEMDSENEQSNSQTGQETNNKNPDSSASVSKTSQRLFLRTLTVEMSSSRFSELTALDEIDGTGVRPAVPSTSGLKTSAAASVDGVRSNVTYEKVQVAVYVHQPFMFVFLFKLRTPSLTMPAFYRGIHHTLGPLQKSLLRSTDTERWKERVRDSLFTGPSAGSHGRSQASSDVEIYSLIYDPNTLTVRTSIPNIPVPGSLASEGLFRNSQNVRPVVVSGSWYTLGIPIGSSASGTSSPTQAPTGFIKSAWTRVEALNVHTHLLNIWAQTRAFNRQMSDEIEHTVKTSRGWWIVWMQTLIEGGPHQHARQDSRATTDAGDTSAASTGETTCTSTGIELAKEAFLVRISSDRQASAGRRDASQSRSSSGGRWLLREQPKGRETSGTGSSSDGSGTTSARGVSEGVGVDARKWVDGLLRLTM